MIGSKRKVVSQNIEEGLKVEDIGIYFRSKVGDLTTNNRFYRIGSKERHLRSLP